MTPHEYRELIATAHEDTPPRMRIPLVEFFTSHSDDDLGPRVIDRSEPVSWVKVVSADTPTDLGIVLNAALDDLRQCAMTGSVFVLERLHPWSVPDALPYERHCTLIRYRYQPAEGA